LILVILPGLTLGVVFLAFAGKSSDRVDRDWRQDLLPAATACGAVAAFGSELLSALRSLDQAGAAALWGGAAVATAVVGRASVRRGWTRLRAELRRPEILEAALLAGLTALCAVLFLTAVLSPPNNVDSLNVHLVRVVRWAQLQSLSAQVGTSRPPWAEVMMLHLRQLYGSDRPVALVQWASFVGILVVAAAVAARLGANRRGQAVSAAFAASLPLAVLTASNTKNDLVVAFWLVGLSYWAVLSRQRRLSTSEVALCGAGIALGLLTKGTFALAAFPLVIWIAANLARRSPTRAVLARGAVIVGAVLVLNLGFWMRNVLLEGTPYGDVELLRRALEVDDLLGQGRSAGWPFFSRAASLMAL